MTATNQIDCGAVNILSVGEGHIRLTFDNQDTADTIRAQRIVKDMLRRGYALLIATKGDDGTVSWSRAKDFDESTNEYIVVDYDPEAWRPPNKEDAIKAEQVDDLPQSDVDDGPALPHGRGRPKKGTFPTKRVPAGKSEAISVGRTAGG